MQPAAKTSESASIPAAAAVPPVQSARQFLRAGSMDLHRQCDAAFDWAKYDTLDTYAGLLFRLHSTYCAISRCTRPYIADDLAERLNRDLTRLRHDLADVATPHHRPPLAPTLNVRSKAEAFGALYVIEGSRLGGPILARRAPSHLRLTQSWGARFLHGEAKRTQARWQTFLNYLEDSLADDLARAEALQCARRVFILFCVALNPEERPRRR
jgi:heme oxygenase